jgi:hypothetical protein
MFNVTAVTDSSSRHDGRDAWSVNGTAPFMPSSENDNVHYKTAVPTFAVGDSSDSMVKIVN